MICFLPLFCFFRVILAFPFRLLAYYVHEVFFFGGGGVLFEIVMSVEEWLEFIGIPFSY
jgi:hypothetical protein